MRTQFRHLARAFRSLAPVAALFLAFGCSAPRDETLEQEVLRLAHPDRLPADRAVAYLRGSLKNLRAGSPGALRPAKVRTLLRVAPDCSPAERKCAEHLAERLFAAREQLLAAGGLREQTAAEQAHLVFTLMLEALPDAGCFAAAELEEDGTSRWQEVLPVIE